MRAVILMEDTCGNIQCEYEHGLSVYVETSAHKVLMDTGASEKTLDNAEKLGIDLAEVDTVVLSHGHYDHSGGIPAFREINQKAPIYMQRAALGDYYHGERYIGIDKRIGQMAGVELLDGGFRIDGELSVFTGIKGRRAWPESNLRLSMLKEGRHLQDEFAHEQCLAIHGEKEVLLSGCAHNGILNILDRYRELYGRSPDVVISGFHMMKKADYTETEAETIRQTAKELKEMDTVFYTGHCTGQKAIDLMRPIMGDQLVQLCSGMEVCIG